MKSQKLKKKGGEKMFYQQGDVIIKKCKLIKGRKLSHLTLAKGEATGHHHTITKGIAELYEHEGTLFLKVLDKEATLTHQEHSQIMLPKGDYEINIVQEFDHLEQEARNVAD